MLDEETVRIRKEVIRAMAAQEESSEALDIEMSKEIGTEAGLIIPLASDYGTLMGGGSDADESSDDKATPSPEDIERLFLAAVFDKVRERSAAAALVSPADWLEAGLVPEHFTVDDWEMFVYDYLKDRENERIKVASSAQSAAPIRTATCAVGVPRMLRIEGSESKEQRITDEPVAECSVDTLESDDSEQSVNMEPDNDSTSLFCDDIVVLVGKYSYYLYSSDYMTDAYARWAFLACEDDRILTFAECVRDESRKYPRPMEALSLTNDPFKLLPEEIEELWQTVRDSGVYPDLDTVTASNGDVYYFSTDYLTPTYAASLAEWNSVERDMFL